MPTTMQEFADDYGYQLSFLKSSPELYAIFKKAMENKWDATRFVAAVKGSNWFKTHGEAYRQNLALKTTDPATYKQNLSSQKAVVGDIAAALGARLTYDQMFKVAGDAMAFGWNENQIRDVIGQYIRPGTRTGEAGELRQQLQETAYRNGVTMSWDNLNHWVKQIATGADTLESVQQKIREIQGMRVAPGFEQELKSGVDLYELAAPYMQSMAQTLELNPSDIDLFDPTIRKALGSSTSKDGKPGSVPMWEFEQQLRQDKRFLKTKQAQDQVMAVGNKVLQDFGLIGD